MSEEPKKKKMDLDGDGKVTFDEAKEYARQKAGELSDKAKEKFAELKEEAGEVAQKAKEKAAEIGEEVKDLYDDAKEKFQARKNGESAA